MTASNKNEHLGESVNQTTEQCLNRLEKKLNDRLDVAASKSTRSALLILAFTITTFILGVVLANRYFGTLKDQLQSTQTIQHLPATSQPSVQPDVNARLTSLETLQEAMVSTSKGALEQMNFIFAIVAAFFGVFSFFLVYRQIMSDTSREGHDEEMRNLVRSFQDNINTISSLIITLDKSFAYRGEIEKKLTKINTRAASLETSRKESDVSFDKLIADLNTEAVRLFNAEIDRVGLSLEENRRTLERFSDRMNWAETSRKVEGVLNPFCYFLRGLRKVAIYQYELANVDLAISYTKARADLANPQIRNYAEPDRENIDAVLQKMLALSCYFQGLSCKNIGEFGKSKEHFQEALRREPLHFPSKTYILQVMFFDINVPFSEIEKEYETTTQEFNALKDSGSVDRDRLKKALNVLKVNQGNLYLKKVFPFEFRSAYQHYENQEKALKFYWEAYDYLDDDLTAFAVAQAMEGLGPSDRRRTSPQELYEKSMRSLKRRISEDHDQLYSVMLYYMLAICAQKIENANERPSVFLSQARHSLRQVPSHVTCFSPVNKIRLNRSQILEEMERFEKTLAGV